MNMQVHVFEYLLFVFLYFLLIFYLTTRIQDAYLLKKMWKLEERHILEKSPKGN